MDRTSVARRRTALLAASAIALVFAAAPERARAQFMGSGEVKAGNAEIGGNTVEVLAPRTVIDWIPTDTSGPAAIDFLPANSSVFYQSSSLTDYTVLNRILPSTTSMIGLNGTIASTVYDGGEGQNPGGNVWFYTPYGFVIGSGATISVGGLILTTNDIQYGVDGNNGAIFTDSNGAIRFSGAADSKSPVIIESGAGIIGNNANSYIAVVAPRIAQRGFVSADRSIAYVAGEAVDLTINQGNFSIVVGQGTTDANGVVHTGITTGGQSITSSDGKTISFVAIPKNEALTMMLGGSIGYTQASSAFNDGSSIVLTAGSSGSPAGNIRIGQGEFQNRVDGNATGDLTVAPDAPGSFSEGTSDTVFRSFTNLSGEQSVHVVAAGGTRIQADQSLTLRTGTATAPGTIDIEAYAGGLENGAIAVSGNLSAIADQEGGTSEDGTTGLDAQAGSIAVEAYGGTISAGSLGLSARANGGSGTSQGGNGSGGTINLAAGFGGTITSGFTQLDATGDGGQGGGFVNDEPVGGQGGIGRGGTITIADSLGDRTEDPDGGLLDLDFLFLSASAVGGNTRSGFGFGAGGDAFGGTIDIMLDRQDQTFSFLFAEARGDDGNAALDPIGGDITMTVGGGISVDLESLSLDAGASTGVNGPEGAFARGGTIDLTVTEGAILRTEFSMNLEARADTSLFFFDGEPDSTADLTGGDVTMSADGGTIAAGFLFVDVGAYNYGAATRAGFARGGTAALTAANGGSLGTRAQDGEGTPEFHVDADAYTGAGTAVGESRGGEITLEALSGGTIVAPFITIELDAAGETGIVQPEVEANGAPAFGGSIAIDAIGGAIEAPINAYAFGEGGSAELDAGSGTGGAIDVRVLDGGALTGSLFADAYGQGGQSFVNGDGGNGTGGSFSLLTDATASLPFFYLYAAAYGRGGAATDGQGGDGTGGSAQVDILGGTHTWSGAYIGAYAEGAASQGAGSVAGSAFGSDTPTQFHIGESASLSMSFLSLDASAFAFANGGANEAVGGTAGLLVDGGAQLESFGTTVDASATMALAEESPSSIDTTPTVRGGTASAVADGGTIRTSNLHVLANAATSGALTAAGSAEGGSATAGAANGGLIEILEGGLGQEVLLQATSEFASGLVIEAIGFGAEGPAAAHATGGTATLFANGGTVISPFEVIVNADAVDGPFAGYFANFGFASDGFDATGGTALVEMHAGTSGTGLIQVPSLLVSAQGRADRGPLVAGNGGNGTGGTATLDVADGELDIEFSLRVQANGYGGAADEHGELGTAFASGNGQGGTATFLLSGGTVSAPDIGIEAEGIGAFGTGINEGATPSLAGNGTGGTARFSASGGTLFNSGFSEGGGFYVDAYGLGGHGAFNPNGGTGGNGGDGNGGTALFEAPAGSTAVLDMLGDITVFADGVGGYAGSSASELSGVGGNATGGSAAMRLADIGFEFGRVLISGSGYAGFGEPGGVGDGGFAEFALVDSGSGAAPRTIASLEIVAEGSDYLASTQSGAGGETSFNAEVGGSASALTITGDLRVDAGGTTAPDGSGFTGSVAGAPVTVGGTATVLTPGSGTLTITDPGALAVAGDLIIHVGGSFTSTGAISTLANASVIAPAGISMTDLSAGGTTLLQASAGPVTVSNNLLSGGLVTVLGRTVDLRSLGALAFADADATVGDLSIESEGNLDLVTVDAAGAVTLASNAGTVHNTGAVNGTDLTFIAGVDVISDTTIAANGNLTVDAGGVFSTPDGSASATGNVSLSADLGLNLASVVSGGTTLLQADGGAVTVDSLTSTGAVTALAEAVSIFSPGALTVANAQATAGDVQIGATGDLAIATAGATGDINLASAGGGLSSAGPIAAGGALSASGATGVELGEATSGDTTSLFSSSGAITVANLNSTGAVSAEGTAVDIGSTGGLTVTSAQATAGNLSLTTAQALSVANASAAGTVVLSSGGNLDTSGPVSGAGVSLAGANVTLAGSVSSTAALALSAQQLLTVNALATGTTIAATSGDISIGSSGRLGSRGLTDTLALAATSTSAPMNFGGTGTSGQYSLDGSEASRVFADERIAVVSGSGSITIGDLAMSYGTASTNNIGTGGTLKVDTAGVVTVAGAVALSTSSASDTFSIDPSRIEVVAGPGSIAMLGSGGTPLGALVLEGGTIAVADQSTLASIEAAGDFETIKRLLDQPTATASDTGFLQAGSIDLFASDALYIQNTGASSATVARRGFTAGALNIDTGSASTRIAINGVILGSAETLVGRQAIDFVTINGEPASRGGAFNPFSTINGCVIGTACVAIGAPTESDLETPVGVNNLEGSVPSESLFELADTEPLITPPLVDEPITGVGNDDLWQVHCDPEEDKQGCPAGRGETEE